LRSSSPMAGSATQRGATCYVLVVRARPLFLGTVATLYGAGCWLFSDLGRLRPSALHPDDVEAEASQPDAASDASVPEDGSVPKAEASSDLCPDGVNAGVGPPDPMQTFADCGDASVDLAHSSRNCGECFHDCGESSRCNGGACDPEVLETS